MVECGVAVMPEEVVAEGRGVAVIPEVVATEGRGVAVLSEAVASKECGDCTSAVCGGICGGICETFPNKVYTASHTRHNQWTLSLDYS